VVRCCTGCSRRVQGAVVTGGSERPFDTWACLRPKMQVGPRAGESWSSRLRSRHGPVVLPPRSSTVPSP